MRQRGLRQDLRGHCRARMHVAGLIGCAAVAVAPISAGCGRNESLPSSSRTTQSWSSSGWNADIPTDWMEQSVHQELINMGDQVTMRLIAYFREAPQTPSDIYTESFAALLISGPALHYQSNPEFRRFAESYADGNRIGSNVFAPTSSESPQWTQVAGHDALVMDQTTRFDEGIDLSRTYLLQHDRGVLSINIRAEPNEFNRHVTACERVIASLVR